MNTDSPDFENNFFGCPAGYDNTGVSPASPRKYYWEITTADPSHAGITIRFYNFDVENHADFVNIYQNSVNEIDLQYQFTGRLPQGGEEVYIESTTIIIELEVTGSSLFEHQGFLAVYNWNNPCKKYDLSPSENKYVSYLPFDHIGCVGDVPSGLDTTYYYFPLNFYPSASAPTEVQNRIIYVITDLSLTSGSSVVLSDSTFDNTGALVAGTVIDTLLAQ